MLAYDAVLFIGGLALLVKSSDYFVKSAVSIARAFGISEFIIGLTLVAAGTSLPELAAAIDAALKGETDLIVGNVVGSNIANIGLIVGAAAALCAIKTKHEMLKRDGYIMLFSAALFYAIVWFRGSISGIESIVLLLLYLAYILFLLETKTAVKGQYHFKAFLEYFFKMKYLRTAYSGVFSKTNHGQEKPAGKQDNTKKDLLTLAASCIGVIIGAEYMVKEAVIFAELFNIQKTVIGASIIAIGTSLPEFSISIVAAKKGYGEISLGNIIGSNIVNLLLILGIAGLITAIPINHTTAYYTAPAMVLLTVLLLAFMRRDWTITRLEGAALLVLYAIFMAGLIATAAA